MCTLGHEYRHVWQSLELGVKLKGFNIAAELDAGSFGVKAAYEFLTLPVPGNIAENFVKHSERLAGTVKRRAA